MTLRANKAFQELSKSKKTWGVVAQRSEVNRSEIWKWCWGYIILRRWSKKVSCKYKIFKIARKFDPQDRVMSLSKWWHEDHFYLIVWRSHECLVWNWNSLTHFVLNNLSILINLCILRYNQFMHAWKKYDIPYLPHCRFLVFHGDILSTTFRRRFLIEGKIEPIWPVEYKGIKAFHRHINRYKCRKFWSLTWFIAFLTAHITNERLLYA